MAMKVVREKRSQKKEEQRNAEVLVAQHSLLRKDFT